MIDVWLAKQFPSDDPRVNRELVRLLVALQSSEALDAMLATYSTETPRRKKNCTSVCTCVSGQGLESKAKGPPVGIL